MVDKREYWTVDELRTLAYYIGSLAQALGGEKQAILEQAEEALFDAAKQLESV